VSELDKVRAECKGLKAAKLIGQSVFLWKIEMVSIRLDRIGTYMSAPERIPLSNPMASFPFISVAIAESASSEAIAPSIWRPPC
jgi:hypothetical protein